jgi:hypothetical protein
MMMLTPFSLMLVMVMLLALTCTAWAFQPPSVEAYRRTSTSSSTTALYSDAEKDWSQPIGKGGQPSNKGQGRYERLEYTIFPDGTVTQKVFGVKGTDCLKITKNIEEALGQVISTEFTEEYYEEPVQLVNTVVNVEEGMENGGGTSTW